MLEIEIIFGIIAVMIIGLIIRSRHQKRKNKALAEAKRLLMLAAANVFIAEIKKNKALPIITAEVFLDKDEHVFLKEETKLMETRAVRHSKGGFGSVRVMKGVRIGGYSGQSESSQEWRTIDAGVLLVTNKKIVFMGNRENRTVPINKVFALKMYADAIEFSFEHRAKSMLFFTSNPFIAATVINIVQKVPDPLNFGNIEITSDFK
jgi:hypothetical protein